MTPGGIKEMNDRTTKNTKRKSNVNLLDGFGQRLFFFDMVMSAGIDAPSVMTVVLGPNRHTLNNLRDLRVLRGSLHPYAINGILVVGA